MLLTPQDTTGAGAAGEPTPSGPKISQFPKGLIAPIDSTTKNRNPQQQATLDAVLDKNSNKAHMAPDIREAATRLKKTIAERGGAVSGDGNKASGDRVSRKRGSING